MRCVTLLSDLGLQDASVASIKGILLQNIPEIPVIDISHLAKPYHLQQAAYLLTIAYKNFPPNSCHVLLVDVFSVKNPVMMLCKDGDHYFLTPDNGLLFLALGKQPDQVWQCYKAQNEDHLREWVIHGSRWIKKLQQQSPEELGLLPSVLTHTPVAWQPRIVNNTVECHVIYIDRFENVVLNITKEQFEKIAQGRSFSIRFTRDEEINSVSNHYVDVRENEKLCRFNSAGYLEIAVRKGNAASLFGLKLHQEQHLLYNTIKIFFE